MHSYREKPKGLKKFANAIALHLADEVWVNNEEIAGQVRRDYDLHDDRLIAIRHLLRPTEGETNAGRSDPTFDAFAACHSPILMSSAWRLMEFEGKDLYGFDVCVDLINRLKKTYPSVGLVLFIGRNDDRIRFQNLQRHVNDAGVSESMLILDGDRRTLPYLPFVDLFLRCTRSDSFGISVAEAIYAGTPVVASDVCERPDGAITYNMDNFEDLVGKSVTVLQRPRTAHKDAKFMQDSLEILLSRYKRLLKS